MAERDPLIPEGEGEDNQGQDDGEHTPQEEKEGWDRYWKTKEDEERKQKNDADKYKDKVSEKTFNRWSGQDEESQKSQEKTWTWEDNQGYGKWKEQHGLTSEGMQMKLKVVMIPPELQQVK